jgi:hypothetical protein
MKLYSLNTMVVLALAGMLLMPGALLGTSAASTGDLFDGGPSVTLSPADGPNGAYMEKVDGKYQLNLTDVPQSATITLNEVFTITNSDSQDVSVWVTADARTENVTFRESASQASIETNSTSVELQPGEDVTVDLRLDTHGKEVGDTMLEEFTIHTGYTTDSGDGGDGISGGEDEEQPEEKGEEDHREADQDDAEGEEQPEEETEDVAVSFGGEAAAGDDAASQGDGGDAIEVTSLSED